MALFGRDYDETYARNWSDRGQWDRSGRAIRPTQGDYYGTYGAGNRGAGDWGYGRPAMRGYGEEYYGRNLGRGYGPVHKSRWETDNGDPFGDRQQQTPMRVIRGAARGYDRGLWTDYDRDYTRRSYPMGYRPYAARAGYDTGYAMERPYRTYGRGFESGWY